MSCYWVFLIGRILVIDKIIDIHVHCGNYDDIERNTDSIINDIIQYMLDNKIFMCILLGNSEDKYMCGNNEVVRSLCKLYPNKFAWMCNIDKSDVKDIDRQIEKYKNQGACGIGELILNKRFDDLYYETLFASAQKFNMPVLFHMSPCEGFSYGVIDEPGLPLLEKELNRFSELKFIGHSQVFWHEISGNVSKIPEERNRWGKGPVLPGGRLVYLLDNYKNLYCDLFANSGGCAIMRDIKFGLEFIEKYSDRLLFGSDIWGNGKRYPLLQWMVDMKQKQLIREETFYKICYENATRIFFAGKYIDED